MKISLTILTLLVSVLLILGFVQAGFANNDSVISDPATDSSPTAVSGDIFSVAPDYDSGWFILNKDTYKKWTHNLGGNPDDYIVNLQFKDTSINGLGVHQMYYGGVEYIDFHKFGDPWVKRGAYWYGLTDKEIRVYRHIDDIKSGRARVRIWKAQKPAYNEGWTTIPNGLIASITHSVGGNSDDYIVDLQYKNPNLLNSLGVNHFGYGMMYSYITSLDLESRQAFWSGLTNTMVFVDKGTTDDEAKQVRLRIWQNKTPDYDSGWVMVNPTDIKELKHNLLGNPDEYVVDLQFREKGGFGVNQRYYGGNHYTTELIGSPEVIEGAHWHNLTNTHISVYREFNDTAAPEVRVRIWYYGNHNYLPLAIKK